MKKKQSDGSIKVMTGLARMVKPLMGRMSIAIILGSIGHLMAAFLTISGSLALLGAMGLYEGLSLPVLFTGMAVCAVLRGVFRYGEQACNHDIAFKLLARIRHQVFAALRKLAPAKLDGSNKGNLISMITSDIEQLEVFFAHTISPIVIAVVTSVVMVAFLSVLHPAAGILAFLSYAAVGLIIPVWNSRSSARGLEYRNSFGSLNTSVLDNLYGLEEILQYGAQKERLEMMAFKTERLEAISSRLKDREALQKNMTDWVILSSGVLMALVTGGLAAEGHMKGYEAVAAVTAMMSSFGPTAALSALSNNLKFTLASGKRVIGLLEESPLVEDVVRGKSICEGALVCDEVSFSYGVCPSLRSGTEASADKELQSDKEVCPEGISVSGVLSGKDQQGGRTILDRFAHTFEEGRIHGVLGSSGCGKSTLLKLLMRFYEVDSGKILYGDCQVERMRTKALREGVAYVTQETFLFQDTIENNILAARPEATRQEVEAAARKASVHEFILSLPQGYDTRLEEAGKTLSGGERQRIGIARAFLHGGRYLFLDEPTSNLDSLNEGIILKSLEREKKGRTILLVSHRRSTLGIADAVIRM